MSNPPRGLYEELVSEALAARLRELTDRLEPRVDRLRSADVADRVALHLARAFQRVVADLGDEHRAEVAIEWATKLLQRLDELAQDADLASDVPLAPGQVLRAILGRLPDGSLETISDPLTPLRDTTLLTHSPGEPRIGSQLLTEIDSADRIDVVMAFIRRSGIYPQLDALRRHCQAGRRVRVLTTTYTNSTEGRALDLLRDLGAEIRVSYDTSTTRLHAKAWLFHRESGFSTAYVGSSNLTHSALVTGLEWNVRVSGARNPDVVAKIVAVFEGYWNSGDFLSYDADEFVELTQTPADGPRTLLSPVEIRLEPFQERLLEQIQLSRQQGLHRNLLAAATGTGKTVMAAVDYARLREKLPRSRLLFVAHRHEILDQSLRTFRHALRNAAFGELWVAGQRPRGFEHVFASIQSLNASGLGDLDPRHFDVVIVDEFHHAAAPSYRALLEHVQPLELLGLTATPERSDGLPVLEWFGNRIAAELRLWDAIEQRRLVPFTYYGISDGTDLREVPWRRGRGYDATDLSNLYTANDVWARRVIAEVERRVDDPQRMRALGFCVSIDHARHMERVFNAAGIGAAAVWGESPETERASALRDLDEGRLRILFCVDLFNEGVDLPRVDTLLLLRPTDSPTLFLQQLGRGLRRGDGKSTCTVLDFVGQHRSEYRFERRFKALLGGTRKEVERQIRAGFPFLPAGCHLELDAIAQQIVLANIQSAIPSKWTAKVEELRTYARDGRQVTLSAYLEQSGLEPGDVYAGSRCWSDLREAAQLPVLPSGPDEAGLRRAVGRLLHVDDRERLDGYRRLLASNPPDVARLTTRERRLVRMLVGSVVDQVAGKAASLQEACSLLWQHPQVCSELLEVFDALSRRVDHLHLELPDHTDVPLQVHARYTRIEILAAFGVGDAALVPLWQSGVHFAREAGADLFAFTLDKTTGEFSPTTRYRDYAISRELIHWESQSTTRANSPTGQRYQRHEELGTAVMLFARLRSDERAFWFVGPATYVRHELERPMAVTWKLHYPLPGDLFAAFAAAVA